VNKKEGIWGNFKEIFEVFLMKIGTWALLRESVKNTEKSQKWSKMGVFRGGTGQKCIFGKRMASGTGFLERRKGG